MTPTSERAREIHAEEEAKMRKEVHNSDNLNSQMSLRNYVLKVLDWLGPVTKKELSSYIKDVPSARVYALSWANNQPPGWLYSQEIQDAISELKTLWFIEERRFSVGHWVLLVTPDGKEFLKSLTCLKQQIAHWPQCDWECGNPPHVLCAVAGITEFREWTGSVKHITGTGPQQFEYIGNQPLVPSNKKMDSGR